MTAATMMQQQVRLGFRQNALAATPRGTTNTGVANFAAAVIQSNPASFVQAGLWVSSSNSATLGSSYKFLRKGFFTFDVSVPLVAGELTAVMIAGSLNAVNLLAAGVTPTIALTSYEDYDLQTGVATVRRALDLHFTASIINTNRGTDTYATTSPVGTSALGTVRIHIGDGAGATVTDASVDVANATLRCSGVAEIFG